MTKNGNRIPRSRQNITDPDSLGFCYDNDDVFAILILEENLELAKQKLRRYVTSEDNYLAYGGQFPEWKPTVTIHNIRL